MNNQDTRYVWFMLNRGTPCAARWGSMKTVLLARWLRAPRAPPRYRSRRARCVATAPLLTFINLLLLLPGLTALYHTSHELLHVFGHAAARHPRLVGCVCRLHRAAHHMAHCALRQPHLCRATASATASRSCAIVTPARSWRSHTSQQPPTHMPRCGRRARWCC